MISTVLVGITFFSMALIHWGYRVFFSELPGFRMGEHLTKFFYRHGLYFILFLVGCAALYTALLFLMVNSAFFLFENKPISFKQIKKKLSLIPGLFFVYLLVSFIIDDFLTLPIFFFHSDFYNGIIHGEYEYLLAIAYMIAYLPLLYLYIRVYCYPPCYIVGDQRGFSSLQCAWQKTRGNVLVILGGILFLRLVVISVNYALNALFFGAFWLTNNVSLLNSDPYWINVLGAALYFWLSTLLATYIYRCN